MPLPFQTAFKLILSLCFCLFSYSSAFAETLIEPAQDSAPKIDETSSSAFSFKPYRAEYQVYAKGFKVGKAIFTLAQLDDGSWEYRSQAKPGGIAKMFTRDTVTEFSRFALINGRVQPIQSEYQRKGKKNETGTTEYDWNTRQAVFTRNGTAQTVELSDLHQDRTSVVSALVVDAANGLQKTQHPVIDKRMLIRNHQAQPIKKIKLKKLGEVAAIHYKQIDNTKRTVDAWLAPELNYLPIQVEQFRKGKSQVRMKLIKLDWK